MGIAKIFAIGWFDQVNHCSIKSFGPNDVGRIDHRRDHLKPENISIELQRNASIPYWNSDVVDGFDADCSGQQVIRSFGVV